MLTLTVTYKIVLDNSVKDHSLTVMHAIEKLLEDYPTVTESDYVDHTCEES